MTPPRNSQNFDTLDLPSLVARVQAWVVLGVPCSGYRRDQLTSGALLASRKSFQGCARSSGRTGSLYSPGETLQEVLPLASSRGLLPSQDALQTGSGVCWEGLVGSGQEDGRQFQLAPRLEGRTPEEGPASQLSKAVCPPTSRGVACPR